jgi:hypothetical protein
MSTASAREGAIIAVVAEGVGGTGVRIHRIGPAALDPGAVVAGPGKQRIFSPQGGRTRA